VSLRGCTTLTGKSKIEGVKITSKGQVTIPQHVRERFGLLPHTEVEFRMEGDRVFLEKVEGSGERGRDLISRMRGAATVRMTTDEIMELTRS